MKKIKFLQGKREKQKTKVQQLYVFKICLHYGHKHEPNYGNIMATYIYNTPLLYISP